jgi:YVTN family beta-propeller protein
MNRLHAVVSLLVLLLAVGGCKKDNAIVDSGFTNTAGQVVYVVNEGLFNAGNASITLYLPDSLEAFQDVFENANNGRHLGDVGNDMAVRDTVGYIVVNNSQKIEVVALATMKSIGTVTIPGTKSPYKIAIYSGSKAYVTNLFDNSVTVFNPTTLTIVKERIPVGANPEGIAVCGDKIYVCNRGSEYGVSGVDSTVSVIDPLTDTVVKTIVVGKAPTQAAVDGQGNLIVRCEGFTWYEPDPVRETSGSLVKIDQATGTVAMTLPLPLASYNHPLKMAVSAAGIAYVSVKTGIIKVATSSMTITDAGFITPEVQNLNGMAFDNYGNRLYLAIAPNYSNPGKVDVYDVNAAKTASFTAGIGPGTIAFKNTLH